MKKRTKEEMTAYRRVLRARKKAQLVTPAVDVPVTPSKLAAFPVTPTEKGRKVTPAENTSPCNDATKCQSPTGPVPAFIPCAECSRLRDELTQARAELSRLRARVRELEAQPAKVDLPHLPPVARPLAPNPAGKALDRTEAEALRLRVIADKVSRIRGYSSGHSIGSVRV